MPVVQVLSPWPGRVAELHVETGSAVTAGQDLITIESMKVLTPVPSEHDGRVAAIHCVVGDLVQPGRPLVTLDQDTRTPWR